MKKSSLVCAVVAAIAAAAAVAAPSVEERRSVLRVESLAQGSVQLLIYGPIGDAYWDGGVTAQSVVFELEGMPQLSEIVVRINSNGGSVPEGFAIYNALVRHKARVRVVVDGIAASIASLIAMAGDDVVMHENTLMMLHSPAAATFGNSVQLRDAASVLDTYAAAMTTSYARKTGKDHAEILALLSDGADHYYTAAQAIEYGLADRLAEEAPIEVPESAAAAALLSYVAAISNAPAGAAACIRKRVQTTATPCVFASLNEVTQRAVLAHIEEESMKTHLLHIMAAAAGGAPAAAPVAPAPAAPVAAAPPAPAAPVVAAADPVALAMTALAERNTRIRGVFAGFNGMAGVAQLEADCLADPTLSVEAAQTRLLNRMGSGVEPLAGGAPRVEGGLDQRDRDIAGMTNWILARAMAESRDAEGRRDLLPNADPSNPFRGFSLYAMAEHFVRARGTNTARMTRSEVVALAMQVRAAGHTTSDFPNLLENALNKLLVAAYQGAPTTWERFCRVTDLSDFRAHPRYRIGTFADLKTVNEAGNYEQGSLSDAERETITGKRKGRLLLVTREMIVNDDLQAFADIARGLGRIANRTIEKDVFALFALNGGNGPTMSDGKALFHVDHNNIATVSAAPSMAAFEASRVQMGSQMDPSANDFLDIRPAIWLGPLGLGGTARSVNGSEYDPDATNKLQKPNIVKGLYSDIVDTPRLSGNAWYSLAAPDDEPVFEVGFVGGQRTPTVEQQTHFESDGLQWKVVHEYGTAATGFRGINKNAGG